MTESPRAFLSRLIEERGVEMAALSRLIGKNAAYVHQYIHRGSPKKLGEEERRVLARYFGIDEALLGAPQRVRGDDLVTVSRRSVHASAGAGSAVDTERPAGRFAFDPHWLRHLTGSNPEQLSVIRVEGDSMEPTLMEGDDIMVDHDDAARRLRDGIYVLRVDGALNVKRLALHPIEKKVTVQSDNPAYRDWPDLSPDSIDIVGRVLWAGRRVR